MRTRNCDFLFIFSILLTTATSLVIYDSPLAEACTSFTRTLDWGCSDNAGHMNVNIWSCQCASIEWLGTVTNCIKKYGNSTHEIIHGYEHIMKRCKAKADLTYTLSDMLAFKKNATYHIEPYSEEDTTNVLQHPVSIPTTNFIYYYRSYFDFAEAIRLSQRLGWGSVGYWLGVVGIAAIWHWLEIFYKLPPSYQKFITRYLLLPHDKFLSMSTWEWIVCFFFCIEVLLSCIINYDTPLGAYLATQYYKMIDLVSFRTDLIGFSVMPVVYLMGTRNNPFVLFGGYKRSQMIKYHKIVAWVLFIMAIIHSCIWTRYPIVEGGGYSTWVQDSYFQWGIVGSVCLGILLLQAFKLFRDIMYQVFLVLHQLLAILFIVAMWLHCNTLGWMGWVYSLVAIMALDRVCRVMRILKNGLVNEAQVEYYNKTILKLTFHKPKFFIFFTGCHVYLHFLNPWYTCYQSHPFSVVKSINYVGKLEIYIRVKKGMTKRIACTNGTTKVLTDGPYGTISRHQSDESDSKFDKIIGIAGGAGITSILAIMNQIPEGTKSRYYILWLTNRQSDIECLAGPLAELAKKKNAFIEVYDTSKEDDESQVTNEKSAFSSDSNSGHGISEKECSLINFHRQGRPDLSKHIQSITKESSKVKIYTCGSSKFVRSVNVIAEKLMDTGKFVEYHNENGEW